MKTKKGFTLVEVIIAIGILMLASGFILQIFMTAKNMNERAHAIDQSVSITTNFVETVKVAEKSMTMNFQETFPQSEVTQNSGSVRIKYYYSEKWTLVNLSEKDTALYTFIGTLESSKNNMISIEASVMENKKDKTQRALFNLKAGKWEGGLHE